MNIAIRWFHAPLILLAITYAMFGDILFTGGERILSKENMDIYRQFFFWRDFGFSQIRAGHFPLWNPHLFGGVPYFGGFQSALLYPPNYLFLILSPAAAVNTVIVLHVFLLGLFTYLWAAHRGLHPAAGLLTATMIMFSGSFFLHIFAGHLTNICAMAWTPLIFIIVDILMERPSLGWCLMGMFIVAMQVLAGHPQYVYYTGLAVAIYAVLNVWANRPHLIRRLAAVALAYTGGTLLCAVQILTGIEAANESVRAGGLPFTLSSLFSFPPENMLTFFAPYMLGIFPYWGRGYLWEACLFVGIFGLGLVLFGGLNGDKRLRRYSLTMITILFVLALGSHTPLFNILCAVLPGFGSFRGTTKFIFIMSLFIVMLAGIGFDVLIRNGRIRFNIHRVLLIAGLVLATASGWLYLVAGEMIPADIWMALLKAVRQSRESNLNTAFYEAPHFIRHTAEIASGHLIIASLTCVMAGMLWRLVKNKRVGITCLIGVLAVLEIFAFARISRTDFNRRDIVPPELGQFFKAHPGDYRILNLWNPNSAMSTDAYELWGYDAIVPRRYAQFMAFTQGRNPDHASQYLRFVEPHRLLSILRLRYIIRPLPGRLQIEETKTALPHLLLLRDWKICATRELMFSEMDKTDFDPFRTVLLEKEPGLNTEKSTGKGRCMIIDGSTDHLTIAADLISPAILLITDNYSRGWRISVLMDSGQKDYEIMPANYTLMAVPLSEGRHLFRIEYMPESFIWGRRITVVAGILYFAAILYWLFALKKRKRCIKINNV